MVTQAVFDAVSLDELRKRTSEKWTTYPAGILPAFVAEMDFALAPPLRRALEEAIAIGDCGYAGLAQLAPAFSAFAARRWKWRVGEGTVIGLPDVMAGVSEALHALTSRGDAVVINPPVYPPFFEVIRACERSVLEVPLVLSDALEWVLDFDALEAAFRGGARAYLLCSPQNPAGRVWSGGELVRIAELARKYRVLVIADEIHAPLTMPGVPFVPFLQAAGELDALALHSASKAWNIAGLKCALAVTGSAHVDGALRARMSVSPSDVRWRIGQFGAIASTAAFRDGEAWLDELCAYLDGNRRLLAELLADRLPQIAYRMPDATYLAWLDCRALGFDDAARHFLDGGRVALERGSKFGAAGEGFVRLNFGTSRAILREIVDRMGAASK